MAEADNRIDWGRGIERAVRAERDFTKGQIKVLAARIDAINEATRVLSETVNRTPTEIQKEVKHLRELMDNQFASNKEAITKAEAATDKRLEEIDKSRRSLADIVNTNLPRAEYFVAHKALVDKVEALTTRFERTEGTGVGLKMGWTILVGGIGLLATIVALLAT